MDKSILRKSITTSIENTIINDNKTLKDFLPFYDILELINNIISDTPLFLNDVIKDVNDLFYQDLNKEDIKVILKKEIKPLLTEFITNSINKEKLGLLIFYITFYNNLDYGEINTKELKEYFNSFIIEDFFQLKLEIEKITGYKTIDKKSYYFRISDSNQIIKTTKTLNFFNNY